MLMQEGPVFGHMPEDSQGHSSTDAAGTTSTPDESADTTRAPNTLLNALIGGIAGTVLSFIPFSTVLGGGIAGYLEGGNSTSGAKVGALAGLVAFVPFVFIIGIVLVFVPVISLPDAGVQLALWMSILFILLLTAVYTVGLSMLGGVLGVYVKEEV